MGAIIVSKTETLYPCLALHFKTIGLPYAELENDSICLNPKNEFRFMFLNRDQYSMHFDVQENPVEARERGYVFGYSVECRSEVLFCQIVHTIPPEIDILICDSNGDLYSPREVSPDTISL